MPLRVVVKKVLDHKNFPKNVGERVQGSDDDTRAVLIIRKGPYVSVGREEGILFQSLTFVTVTRAQIK